ncbi:MAG TPA: tRNA (adenosine(37)-N6)-threonylcarbamoyltransferase complex dimerization subunit type 1 TsaB [Anaerolineales bacterium]|nr:tRNA (adenosine(37)-N6)-threonylcarbamoyltransferase complex dimerization subunit type 1 TsaB [Anaerolineales bacterium]
MLLAIDTSTAQIGLALYDGASVPGEFVWHSGLHHTEELAPALAELLRRVDIKMNAITALGVALGPGSFTSLRVGLAFAKGLTLACQIPIVGIPTLDIVAAAVPLPGPSAAPLAPEARMQEQARLRLAAVVQAGRGRLALGWYRAGAGEWEADGPVMVTTLDELAGQIHEPVIVCGELSADDRQRLLREFANVTLASPAQCVRRPALLAELAWQKWQAGHADQAATLAPIYIHVTGGPAV